MKNNSGKILIIDDDHAHLDMCTDVLTSSGYKCASFTHVDKAFKFLEAFEIDVVVTDLIMPKLDGIAFTKAVIELNQKMPVIVLTAFATIEKSVEAVKAGAFDFVEKPVRSDRLLASVNKAMKGRINGKTRLLKFEDSYSRDGMEKLIGKSYRMRQVHERIRKVAHYDMNVGFGKLSQVVT